MGDQREVAAAFWGTAARGQGFVPPDASGLGPAPRELRPEWWRYAKKRTGVLTAFAWAGVAFSILLAIPAAVVPILAIQIQWAVIVAATIFLFVRRNRAARRIAFVLQHGTLVGARVLRSSVICAHRGPDRTDLLLRVADRNVEFSTHDPTVGNMMQPGIDVELVWHAQSPEIIVPTFDLPPI